jgi:hypothetical protein
VDTKGDIMEDRHIRELSSALGSVSSSIYFLAVMLYLGLMFNGCSHH